MVNPVSIKDIYWVAGIVEGEGYIGDKQAKIQVKMKCKDVIDTLSIIWKSYTRVVNASNGTYYSSEIYGKEAIGWMMTIYPILHSRRKERIRLFLNKWKQPRIFCIKRQHDLRIVGYKIVAGKRCCAECRRLSRKEEGKKRRKVEGFKYGKPCP